MPRSSALLLLVLLAVPGCVNAFTPTPLVVSRLGLRATQPQLRQPLVHCSRVPARLRGGATEMSMTTNMFQIAKTGTLIYAVLMGAGGIVAGLKAGSKPSIISGTVASIVLGYAYSASNIALSLGTAVALSMVFAIRFVKTKKFMPAGLLGSLSVIFSVLFGFAKFG